MLAELTYQPPPPPQSTVEPSCAWHGRSNPMASPMAPPRALDPFSHHNLPAPFAFPSTTHECGTRTPGAAHSSAGGTSRNPLVCFQCGGRGHYKSQCPSRPRSGRRGKRSGPAMILEKLLRLHRGLRLVFKSSQARCRGLATGCFAAASKGHRGREGGWRIRREVRRARGLFWWAAGRWDAVTVALGAMVSYASAAEQRPRRFGASAKASRWLVLHCELCGQVDRLTRTAYKTALHLPNSTPTSKLLQLEVHNMIDELVEAHLIRQYSRLSQSETGRQLLQRLQINLVGRTSSQKALGTVLKSKLTAISINDPFLVKGSSELTDAFRGGIPAVSSGFSVDIEELYYSVPHHELLPVVRDFLEDSGAAQSQVLSPFSVDSFLELLAHYLDSTMVDFAGKVFV
ncbi:hypothetical protein HPB50_014585 [Hyalomma asiaticum]|uniref:Uncharacterized protein n=1 Tax=Hyalomma asiaticum TaxID=266040 RepID=A0ACB7SVZ6_HYAAI|nr:hypothetical protein HPB50_014585 [Hyalomma asiaticum]